MYISLHSHYATGSVGDSILEIEKAVKKAKSLGMPALAMTDHGSMSGVVEFYNTCTKEGVKPLIGMEAYEVDDRTIKGAIVEEPEEELNEKKKKKKQAKKKVNERYYHLVLLAVNKQGYKDLLHISADSQFTGFYYKPRTDLEVLSKYGSNIIALSACAGGRIPSLIKKHYNSQNADEKEDIHQEMIDYINFYKEVFYDFYLEIQPGDFLEQTLINEYIVKLAKETNTKIVATNDIHYLDKEDAIIHDQHIKMARKLDNEDDLIYPDSIYYLADEEDIKSMFRYLDEDIVQDAIDSTVEIANAIDLTGLYDGKIKMPKPDIPEGYSEDEYLAYLSHEALDRIKYKLKDPCEYYSRAEYELDTLREVGFSGYLLVIKDIYDYANANDIPMGPGRGSIAGSLVAYLIGITKVDPIKYNLMFERFISRYRKGSVPDVDLDCGSKHRNKLFEYVVKKYGRECCALVSTFQVRKARSSLKDTARIFNVPIALADKAAKLVPQVWYAENDIGESEKQTDLSIEKALEISEELRAIKKDNEGWFAAAMKLEGSIKATSIHAAGTLISPIPLEEYIPLIRKKDDKENEDNVGIDIMATSLNLKTAEEGGAIKYDFLGIATLDVANDTCKDVNFKVDYEDDNFFKDKATWELLNTKYTTTLFQVPSKTYQARMPRLKVKTISELAACLALVRGPCISNKSDEQYMKVVEGKVEVEKIHPFFDDVTRYTNGVLLYQEDLMKVLVNFGFDLEKAFKIMKYAAKKKEKELAQAEEEFRKLSAERRVPKKAEDRIWHIIDDMGKYAFNASHAVSYAIFCYVTAYLKVHYPTYWMANAITNAYERKKDIGEAIREARRLGMKFLPLDINKSAWKFKVESDNEIRIGFVAAKYVGEKAYEALLPHRPIKDLDDLMIRVPKGDFNKRSVNSAILSGAFDYMGTDRVELYYDACIKRKEEPGETVKFQKEELSLFDGMEIIESFLLETLIMYNPLNNKPYVDIDSIDIKGRFVIDAIISSAREWVDKKGRTMMFLEVETNSGILDVVMFADDYKKYYDVVYPNAYLKLRLEKGRNKDDTTDSFILKEVIKTERLQDAYAC